MTPTMRLPGREAQLAQLQALVNRISSRTRTSAGGAAVAVVGEAGSGKTAILDIIAAQAGDLGFLTLRCMGLSCETGTTGAGLHELLHAVLGRAADLPPERRAALDTCFGRADGPAPNRLTLCLAALQLLEEVAHDTPVLIVVDDLQWLDQLTIEVLTFVARRLRTAPILMIAGVRGGGPATDRGLPWPVTAVELGPLPEPAALEVVRAVAPDLDATVRRRILDVAEGNPLALQEFAASASREDLDPDEPLPATRRLTTSLLADLEVLPAPARRFLVLVAASDRHTLPELMPAAARIGLRPPDLDPAEHAGLVRVTGDRVHFRQSLLRHAVYAAAPWSQRTEAHAALAETTLDAARAAWHRSALAGGEDEDAAGDLEAAAGRTGSLPEAVRLLRRAAALTPDPQDRAGRLAAAAELARQAGQPAEARALIAAATVLDPAPATAGRLVQTRTVLALTEGIGPAEAVESVRSAVDGAGAETVTPALAAAGALAWHLELPGRLRQDLIRLVGQAPVDTGTPDDLLIMARTWLDPLTGADTARRRLPLVLAALRDRVQREGSWHWRDTTHLLIAAARTAEVLHDLPMAVRCWALLADAHALLHSAVGEEARRLAGQALTRVLSGRVNDAIAETARAHASSAELGLPRLAALAAAGQALASAWAGEDAPGLAAGGESGSIYADAISGWAAGLVALREERYGDACGRLLVLPHQTIARNAAGDLAEAAAGTGDAALIAAARDRLADAAGVADAFGSDHLRAVVLRGRAVLQDTDADFVASAAAARRAGASLELARTLLAHGTRLRRTGSVVAARSHLAEAHFLFASANAEPWAQKAGAELRAAGVGSVRHETPDAAEVLNPQELRIALMAARGMTNREIAAQMFCSHRTVGSYLYRIFPKLAITNRAQLREALGSADRVA